MLLSELKEVAFQSLDCDAGSLSLLSSYDGNVNKAFIFIELKHSHKWLLKQKQNKDYNIVCLPVLPYIKGLFIRREEVCENNSVLSQLCGYLMSGS